MFRYLYQPLLYKDSIRILILHPSSNDLDPIICTIQHARLSDASLEYEALSYTWGDPGGTKSIMFHDSIMRLAVGDNCYNALRRLRGKDSYRSLWIDAICINQIDVAERARQVCIMDRIFDFASGVVVYLGEQVTECRALLDEWAIVDDLLVHGKYKDEVRPPPNEIIVKQLSDMFDLPWFKRVWVLQEVCDKTFTLFMYGSAIGSFAALWELYYGYNNNALTKRPLALDCIFNPPSEREAPHINLWLMLFRSRECLATDPRDRVFALRSMAGSAKGHLDALIDYSQGVEECFTQVALFLLPVLGLRLLLAVRHPHTLDVSSWIPDWTQNLPLNLDETANDIEPIIERHYEIVLIEIAQRGVSLELHVTGCRYAEVASKSCVFSFRDLHDAGTKMRHFYHGLANLREYVDVESQLDSVETTYKLGQEILDTMLCMDSDTLHQSLHRHQSGRSVNDLRGPEDEFQKQEYAHSLQQCCIVLLDNKTLAITSESAQAGDVVAIIRGAVSPCLLRPNGNEFWTLVCGDCFLFEDSHLSSGDMSVTEQYIEHVTDDIETFRIR